MRMITAPFVLVAPKVTLKEGTFPLRSSSPYLPISDITKENDGPILLLTLLKDLTVPFLPSIARSSTLAKVSKPHSHYSFLFPSSLSLDLH